MKKPKQASWRTLMRKASKAATPAIASKLRTQAAKLRQAERKKRSLYGAGGGGTTTKVFPGFRKDLVDEVFKQSEGALAFTSKAFVRGAEVPGDDITKSLEAELARRDQQLIDEFIAAVARLRNQGPWPNETPHFIVCPNSQIDAIVKALTKK